MEGNEYEPDIKGVTDVGSEYARAGDFDAAQLFLGITLTPVRL